MKFYTKDDIDSLIMCKDSMKSRSIDGKISVSTDFYIDIINNLCNNLQEVADLRNKLVSVLGDKTAY